MTPTTRLILALVPLAAYFVLLGVLHSSRRPRVVAGPVDLGSLAFGLGGLIAFGPFGGLVVHSVFPGPNLPAWLAMASLVALLAMMIAARARNRLVVYNVDGQTLTDAVGKVMSEVASPIACTLHGYEDVRGRRGLTVEVGPWFGWGTVTAYGEGPEMLIDTIRPGLSAHLGTKPQRRAQLRMIWFGLAVASVALLMVGILVLPRTDVPAALHKPASGPAHHPRNR